MQSPIWRDGEDVHRPIELHLGCFRDRHVSGSLRKREGVRQGYGSGLGYVVQDSLPVFRPADVPFCLKRRMGDALPLTTVCVVKEDIAFSGVSNDDREVDIRRGCSTVDQEIAAVWRPNGIVTGIPLAAEFMNLIGD